MSIQVNDFQWEPGKNDAEYIKLLELSRDEWQKIAQKAIAKLKALSKAQLPTVIKHEDFVYYLSKPVWFESHGYYMGRKAFWCFPLAIENGLYVKLIAAHTGTDTTLPFSNYGKAWRCWDKEPSDERSLGVKWE